jgi:D-glycero-D-manno-heptose 1,7-bisphosphate phosphatase
MLLRAMSDWPVDAGRSIMVGDKDGDIEAGRRAGVRALQFKGGNLRAFLADELQQA